MSFWEKTLKQWEMINMFFLELLINSILLMLAILMVFTKRSRELALNDIKLELQEIKTEFNELKRLGDDEK